MAQSKAAKMIEEMKEFAGFTVAEQRYICRSLDVAAHGTGAIRRWSRSPVETANIKAQDEIYRTLLAVIRNSVPDDVDIDSMSEIIGQLVAISALDLGAGEITGFAAYRFLYERLLGPSVRPWLPSAFVGAAALPYLHPDLRTALLSSMTAGDAGARGWSISAPTFIPEWLDEPEITVTGS
ncbi:MAG TPA: hypothetical protein VHE36_12535 [Sphingomicrobium sp.]|nr:hypothetical protein [Sphingomicrobium sp.]